MKFDELNIDERILRAIEDMGFDGNFTYTDTGNSSCM